MTIRYIDEAWALHKDELSFRSKKQVSRIQEIILSQKGDYRVMVIIIAFSYFSTQPDLIIVLDPTNTLVYFPSMEKSIYNWVYKECFNI
jgi:hypothetical protein